jgi:hypothetical protein
METIARRYASWSAALGLLIAATPFLIVGGGIFTEFPHGVVIGCLVTMTVARTAAPRLALCLVDASSSVAGLLGAAVAVGAMSAGTVAGSLPQFFQSDWSCSLSQPAVDYLFKPMLWVHVAGLVPALIIGCASGILLRRALRRAFRPSGILPAL